MKSFFKDLKNNQYTLIGIIAFVILIIAGFMLYRFLFPNIGSPVYGNRLDGIEEVKITATELTKLESTLKENKIVKNVSTNIKGKIFNVIITVADGTKATDAKSLTSIIVDGIEQKQKEYYDIQVFLKNENEEANGYPIIGYLNKELKTFSYSSAS